MAETVPFAAVRGGKIEYFDNTAACSGGGYCDNQFSRQRQWRTELFSRSFIVVLMDSFVFYGFFPFRLVYLLTRQPTVDVVFLLFFLSFHDYK